MMDPVPVENELLCYINGKRHVLPTGRAESTLLQYLRGVCVLRPIDDKGAV